MRLEIGPKDMENGTAMLARRDTKVPKEAVPFDQLLLRVPQLLEEIQVRLLLHSPLAMALTVSTFCEACSVEL